MRRITVNLSDDVFKKIENKRGTRPHFRSAFIDSILAEKLGVPGRGGKQK